jgi:hypothetical protein
MRPLPLAMLGMLLLSAPVHADEARRPVPERVDAQMLVDLELLSDERFEDRTREPRAANDARDDFDLPDWDGKEHVGREPRR